MERARTLGRAGQRRDGAAGERLGISRLANARHRLHAEPDQWRRRLDQACRTRALAMEWARLLAVAQPDEQLRERQRGPGGGHARVAAGLGPVLWAWRELRAASADAGRSRASLWSRRQAHQRRVARAVELRRGQRDAAPNRRR